MAYNRRKRKVKKNIPEAQAHIHSTYNNTVVSITDKFDPFNSYIHFY